MQNYRKEFDITIKEILYSNKIVTNIKMLKQYWNFMTIRGLFFRSLSPLHFPKFVNEGSHIKTGSGPVEFSVMKKNNIIDHAGGFTISRQ